LCVETRNVDSGLTDFLGDDTIISWNITPGPFGIGYSIGDGFVTSDAIRYYFVGRTGADGGGPLSDVDAGMANAIFIVTRAGGQALQSLTDLFSSPDVEPVLVSSDPAVLVDNPILTSDELTMFVSTTSTMTPVPHVQSTTRGTTSDNFGPLTPLHELDSAEGEYPTWISPDQCRLYLTRTVAGQTDIYMASRTPL
jgi:hypothetical protein